MKDLPKVYANPISKKINNEQETFYTKSMIRTIKKDINKKINEIFASPSYIYKCRVKIYYKDDIKEEVIIGKTSNSLLTINNKKININDIIDIELI